MIDVPRFSSGLTDFQVMVYTDTIRGQMIEDPTYHLLSKQSQPVVRILDQKTRGLNQEERASEESDSLNQPWIYLTRNRERPGHHPDQGG